MARKENELFIGADKLNMQGRSIKHPALFRHYATVNVNKISDKPMELIGLDLETNHKTGELRLIGFWDGENYAPYTENFIGVLFSYVKMAEKSNRAIAYWNKLDPFVIYKQFLLELDNPYAVSQSMNRFGKISGEWDKKNEKWTVPPVIEIDWAYGKFGILQAIRSSIQFFYCHADGSRFRTVWAYDIAQLYEMGLEKEATSRLKYYSKVDKSAHLVDWERFETDDHYRNDIVLRSNQLDAMAVYDLGKIIQEEFHTAFGYYPKTLVSQGSLARAAIVASLTNKYKPLFPDDEQGQKDAAAMVLQEINSIGIVNFKDQWAETYGHDFFKDFYSLLTEAYSGGYIEAVRYGTAPEAYYCDIASAYPAVIMKLYDLRNAKITTGTGTPPHIANSYCFIRGVVDIPLHVNFNPITIKHPFAEETNIRAVGKYRASYTLHERDFILSIGGMFSDETWYNIETEGKLSPLAEIANQFIELRTKLRAEKNSAQYMAKIAVNSMYGILFEAVDTFEEKTVKEMVEIDDTNPYRDILRQYLKKVDFSGIEHELKATYQEDYKKIAARWKGDGATPDVIAKELAERGLIIDEYHAADILIEMNRLWGEKVNGEMEVAHQEISRAGYRVGEFFNSVYATIITSETRILIAEACTAIENAGGKPVLVMTDSIFWTGSADMIPEKYWREKKTVGYFEKPTKVYNLICLGSGRYEYEDEDDVVTAKRRGLDAIDMQNPDGITVSEFNWKQAVKLMQRTHSEKVTVKVRTLISVGLALHNHQWHTEDIGRVIEEEREVDLIVGKSKRMYTDDFKDPAVLAERLVDTKSIPLGIGVYGDGKLYDQTLPLLREELMKMQVVTTIGKKRDKTAKRVANHREKHKDEINGETKTKYKQLIGYGYNRDEAKKMSKWSLERITNQMREDGRL
jgi:hypothetical protein